jgi:hypothetical protein
MPNLNKITKRLPIFVQVVKQGSDGQPYRRFFYQSVASPTFYHCVIPSGERGTGELPSDGEALVLYRVSRILTNEQTMTYETDQVINATPRNVTYSAPDSSQVARMTLVTAAGLLL